MFVLRLWREHTNAPWRLALRDADGGSAVGFTDLDELMLFLMRAMNQTTSPGSTELREESK